MEKLTKFDVAEYLDIDEFQSMENDFAAICDFMMSQIYGRGNNEGINMSEYVFKSKYSMEEIELNFKDVDFFSGVKEGLEEALAYEKGKSKRRDDCQKEKSS